MTWPEFHAVVEQTIDAAAPAAEPWVGGMYVRCPLCGEVPEDRPYAPEHVGFKLREGLRRHLEGRRGYGYPDPLDACSHTRPLLAQMSHRERYQGHAQNRRVR